jgi:anti-anti-sigma regulatory factor
MHSKRWRPREQADLLERIGRQAGAFELQGALDFSAAERAIRAVLAAGYRYAVIDMHRVDRLDNEAAVMFAGLARSVAEDGHELVYSGVTRFHDRLAAAGIELREMPGLDLALEWCEDQLLGGAGSEPEPDAIELRDHPLLAGLDDEQFETMRSRMTQKRFVAGDYLFHLGDPADELFLITGGRLSSFVDLQGEPRRVATLGPGGLLGDLAFVMGAARAADVRVDADVDCWLLPHAVIDALRDDSAELRATLLANLLTLVALDARVIGQTLRTLLG